MLYIELNTKWNFISQLPLFRESQSKNLMLRSPRWFWARLDFLRWVRQLGITFNECICMRAEGFHTRHGHHGSRERESLI